MSRRHVQFDVEGGGDGLEPTNSKARMERRAKRAGLRAQTGDIELAERAPLSNPTPPRAAAGIRTSTQQELRPPNLHGRYASGATARMQLERDKKEQIKAGKKRATEVKRLSKPFTPADKRKRRKEMRKYERSKYHPISCIIFVCTDPVVRFWLLCNIVFVVGLTTVSILYLLFIFPTMRTLFNY